VTDAPSSELAALKRDRRAKARSARSILAAAAPAAAAEQAALHFLAHIPLQAGRVLSGYWPIGDEFDPRPLLQAAVQRGLLIGLPVVRRDAPLGFRQWRPGEPLAPAVMGIPVPAATADTVVPEILVVPLLAFDAAGYRLGYGGGYYDRTLDALRRGERPVLAVGLAYAGQEAADVPHHVFDQPLDWVVTEREARKFR